MFETQVETRGDARIFSGSDPAYTAMAPVAFGAATPALTPLMLEQTQSVLVPWDGTNAGQAIGVLALDHDGVSPMGTFYKSGTFDITLIIWPAGVTDAKKRNAFTGTAISVA